MQIVQFLKTWCYFVNLYYNLNFSLYRRFTSKLNFLESEKHYFFGNCFTYFYSVFYAAEMNERKNNLIKKPILKHCK